MQASALQEHFALSSSSRVTNFSCFIPEIILQDSCSLQKALPSYAVVLAIAEIPVIHKHLIYTPGCRYSKSPAVCISIVLGHFKSFM